MKSHAHTALLDATEALTAGGWSVREAGVCTDYARRCLLGELPFDDCLGAAGTSIETALRRALNTAPASVLAELGRSRADWQRFVMASSENTLGHLARAAVMALSQSATIAAA